MKNAVLDGMPHARNLHVWFDVGREVLRLGGVALFFQKTRMTAAAVFMLACAVPLLSFGQTTVLTNDTGIVFDWLMWPKSNEHETTEARLAWPGKVLTDVGLIKGTMAGAWIDPKFESCYVEGLIYDRTPSSLKVQFQCVYAPKVLRAELDQTTDGVTIRLTGAGVMTLPLGDIQPDSVFSGTTPIGADGYGVKGVEVYEGSVYEMAEFPRPEKGGIIISNGTLRVNLSKDVITSVPISGNGRLWVAASETPSAELTSDVTLPADESWVTVLENTDLKNVKLTGGDFSGDWVDKAVKCEPYNEILQGDGSIIVQLQRMSWNEARCVRISLRQQGDNVEAKGLDSYGSSDAKLGDDATKWKKNDGFSTGHYIISNLSFSRDVPYSITLRGEKTWERGTLVDGVRFNVFESIMPDHSTVVVTNGGILQLSAENVWDHFPTNTYELSLGAQLWVAAFDAVNCGDTVIADGAQIKILEQVSYFNALTLKNGATLSGGTVRVGNVGAAVWRTVGEQPIVVTTSIETVECGNDPITFDVTADLELVGRIFEFEKRKRMPIVKEGRGVLTFGDTVTSTGTMRLNGGGVVVNDNLSVNGGLILGGDSSLTIASGKSALFGDSSTLTWTAGKTLNLFGAFADEDKTLRIGSTKAGLRTSYLRAIRIGSSRACLDDEGWVHQKGPGLILLFR